ncbi:MAG: MarR family transcriptional regulator [Pseudomonadota bacterium]|jgi:DNA-binding MarR family transcriptional regulator|uniref:MarR family winged helix-turn-helix transcriptional regulator n=1 Tax=Limnohabitans sp. 103DPR2 TaxID=1678129 RepID=UPI0006DCE4ED|nr:MarR family transcriptional regulator [Limnohabitans sp. 103DPR2]ALK92956.1 Organic hydroperoxide resistance transcriptional regulator [Limnohabitans sp. 103DPR2]MBU3722299.1 MarR family transcriptional regulator [Limnohabitans sp.]MDE3232223.1 MarR family transcriptional regulator [Pseudomonadota bacterium]
MATKIPGNTQSILKHWHESVPDDRLAHLVRDAGRAFNKRLQVRLQKYNVSFGHWTFLRILWTSDGLTQKELSDLAGVMEPTTFSAIQAMEALGYVVRKQKPENRKNMYVHLTPKGKALKKALVPLAVDVNHVAVHGVSQAELLTTRKVLLKVIENLAQEEAQMDGRPSAP